MFQQCNVTLDLFLTSQRSGANFSSKKRWIQRIIYFCLSLLFNSMTFSVEPFYWGDLQKTSKTSIKGCRPRYFGKRPTYSVFTLVIKTITQSNQSNCYCCTPRPAIKVRPVRMSQPTLTNGCKAIEENGAKLNKPVSISLALTCARLSD